MPGQAQSLPEEARKASTATARDSSSNDGKNKLMQNECGHFMFKVEKKFTRSSTFFHFILFYESKFFFSGYLNPEHCSCFLKFLECPHAP